MPKKNIKVEQKEFIRFGMSFSKSVLILITVIWLVQTVYAAILMTLAIYKTQQFFYLDIFITQINETFRSAVVAILITRTVGNIFEYNNGGIFGISREYDNGES